MQGFRLIVLASGDEHADDLGAGRLDGGGGSFDGEPHLFRSTVDGTDGQKNGGLKVGGDIGVECKKSGIIDGGFVGAHDDDGFGLCGLNGLGICGDDVGARTRLVFTGAAWADADGLFTGQTGVAGFKQDVGERILTAYGRAEHCGLLDGRQCCDDS